MIGFGLVDQTGETQEFWQCLMIYLSITQSLLKFVCNV
jgi:hypothetical protein